MGMKRVRDYRWLEFRDKEWTRRCWSTTLDGGCGEIKLCCGKRELERW